MRKKVTYIVGALVVLASVFLIVFASSNSAANKKDDSLNMVVIDNEKIKPMLNNAVDSSMKRILSDGGEMNYFVKGYNVDLSVYNPAALPNMKAASYLGNPDGKGGSYSKVTDDQNFALSLPQNLVPKKDDTFALWYWDGNKDYTSGMFIADVGLDCKSPEIGKAPTFGMCRDVMKQGVIAQVKDGYIVQVDNIVETENKTVRTLAYGVTQAVAGVLYEVYGR